MLSNKKASMVVYVLIVVFMAMVISYVVLSKVNILTNNLGLGLSSQSLQSKIFEKGNKTLSLVNNLSLKFDNIFDKSMTCPSDVEVDFGTGTWQVATFKTVDGTCKGSYNGEDFEITFGAGKLGGTFGQVKKAAETINLETAVLATNKIAEQTNISNILTVENSSNTSNQSSALDSNTNTYFFTNNAELDYKEKYITFALSSSQNISKITIQKPANYDFHYKYIFTYDNGQVLEGKNRYFGKGETSQDLELKTNNFDKKISKIKIIGTNKFENLAISDIKLDTFSITGQKFIWKTVSDFTSGNIKSISFNSNSTTGNIKKSKTNPLPRLTFFGTIKAKSGFENIYWNNYKTDEFIEKNTNNNDGINKKSTETEKAHFYLETQTGANFDLKIIEFLKNKYKDENTLVQTGSFYEKHITTSSGYISINGLESSTGSAINFDLKNSDYALFVKNNDDVSINYKLTAKTASGVNIYINPINDSGTGKVEVLANNIITGPEKVYFGENLKMETYKYDENNNFKPKTCLEILNKYPNLKNENGYYTVYLTNSDGVEVATNVYCDMTTSGGGWTRYVNIKGNYTLQNAKDCWLGNNINNENIECFNPNRYGIAATQLMNNDWSGQYIFDIPTANVGAKVGEKITGYGWSCLGHNDYMIIMKSGTVVPKTNASNAPHVWLGRSYCRYNREPGAKAGRYMNYDTLTSGTNLFGKKRIYKVHSREPNAKPTKLYFREAKPSGSSLDLTKTQIVSKTISSQTGNAWDNGTYAKSCNEYKNPKGGYEYSGSIGDGLYFIDSDGDGGKDEFLVYCDMSTDGGGWTFTNMIADQTTRNWFKTQNTDKITSLTNNISTKGQIDNIWKDKKDKDLLFQCFTSDSLYVKYTKPFIVYGYKYSDINNLTKTVKQNTTFSSSELTAKYEGNTYQLEKEYGGSGSPNSFYLRYNSKIAYGSYSSYGMSIFKGGDQNLPARHDGTGSPTKHFDTSNYCVVAIR